MHVLRGDSSNDRASSVKAHRATVRRDGIRVERQIFAAHRGVLGDALPVEPSARTSAALRALERAHEVVAHVLQSPRGMKHDESPRPSPRLTARRSRAAALVGILTLAVGALTPHPRAAADTQWQAIDVIKAAAVAAMRASIGKPDASIESTPIDERLRLPACSRPLDARLEHEVRNGQGTVAVACTGTEPWKLFVPVRVVEQVSIVVARHVLSAGAVLSADDLEVRTQASTSLPLDYLSDLAQAVGLTVRRTVPAGTVLAGAALEAPEIIARGALVTLVSGSGAVRVKSEGVALEGAHLKGHVRVKTPSGRIVEGIVEASGEVRVGT
jgi:flagella basal body P-ring formation protein FlgA